MANDDLSDYGLSDAPEAMPAYRRQRLHEYGITGAEDAPWNDGFASSNVAAFRWNAGDPYPLQVRFNDGRVYGYAAPEEVYEGLLFAPSKGKYLDASVKKPGYPYLRLA